MFAELWHPLQDALNVTVPDRGSALRPSGLLSGKPPAWLEVGNGANPTVQDGGARFIKRE